MPSEPPPMKTIVVRAAQSDAGYGLQQLLQNSGFAIAKAESADEAQAQLASGDHALMVIDLPDPSQLIQHIQTLQNGQLPKHVVVLCDQPSDLNPVPQNYGSCQFHVLPRAIHMYGMLGLIRRLDRAEQAVC